MSEQIKFTLNGKKIKIEADPSQTLLWFLRTELELTGTKYGCGIGVCGACAIMVDGVAERSCNMTVKDIIGKKVTTIEGLAKGSKLHPVQKSFIMNEAQQCGYCTSGMIMTAVAFLNDNPRPSRGQIIDAMNDNLCRCGAYNRITKAVEMAANEINGGTKK